MQGRSKARPFAAPSKKGSDLHWCLMDLQLKPCWLLPEGTQGHRNVLVGSDHGCVFPRILSTETVEG